MHIFIQLYIHSDIHLHSYMLYIHLDIHLHSYMSICTDSFYLFSMDKKIRIFVIHVYI
jgi:hypothetical protein